MSLKLYNTLNRRLEIFKPIKPGKLGLYTCGPTVYNYAHLGNLRTYIFTDILKRVLKYNNYKVKHVMNITDVGHLTSDADQGEDKIEEGAKREGKTAKAIADFYTKIFQQNLADLNILPPNKWTKATEHITEQIALIKKLVKKGFTYKTTDGIYFDSAKLKDYGKLANIKKQKLQAGARIKLGAKKNMTDFALWKFSPPTGKRQMEWASPWGIGFPGWHLECSAMSVKYLGQPFDIHCGGIDHIPVHHTNEIAQSEAANDRPLANYWLHGEFLLIKEGKMAKSANNFLTLQSIIDKGLWPIAYRYFLLQTHYRKQLNFSWPALQAATNGLRHLYNSASLLTNKAIGNKTTSHKFLKLINDDLNIPEALALVWETLKNKKINLTTLLKFDEVLGLKIKQNLISRQQNLWPAQVQKLVRERDQARKNKDWGRSDELRNELQKLGYKVEDHGQTTMLNQV